MSLPWSAPALLAVTVLSLAACERGARGADGARDAAAPPIAHDSAQRVPGAHGDTARQGVARERAIAPQPTSDTSDPTATVRAYFDALRAHSATRDTMLWEPATGSEDGFRSFRDTTVTGFRIGAPGRIEGAAGPRYVDVPVTLDLAARTSAIELAGRVTLRRAVVDGATEAQRRWRITRIQWGVPTASSLDAGSSHR